LLVESHRVRIIYETKEQQFIDAEYSVIKRSRTFQMILQIHFMFTFYFNNLKDENLMENTIYYMENYEEMFVFYLD